MNKLLMKAKSAIAARKGSGQIDTAVAVVIGVVCGALVLGALYFILKDTVMTSVDTKVGGLFTESNITDPLA